MEKPTDEDFKTHFESPLNPAGEEPPSSVDPGNMYAPITDDPITPEEVDDAIRTIKPDKSGGPSGISPGVLKLLPTLWIIFVAIFFFSVIFYNVTIPLNWCSSRLTVLFKTGAGADCNNYRDISVMDSFAKLYDLILLRGLDLWFKPCREQAGAQKGRGFMELVCVLRLLFDYAMCRKTKLFVIYVDLRKAYDRVPRKALVNALKNLGCGSVMVMAIASPWVLLLL